MRAAAAIAILLAAAAWTAPVPAAAQQRSPNAVEWGCKTEQPAKCYPTTNAWFSAPTDRYGHAVLGDTPEWGALTIENAEQGSATLILTRDRVFEDIYPRLADLNGDGVPEVIVVESSTRGGGQLAVYDLIDGQVKKIASTPPIGRRNRWLAPIGAADFDGDGQNDVAYIDRPHLAKVLRIWTMRGANLEQIASASGFSNHRIGQAFITGGVRDCSAGPEMVLPNFNWTMTMMARMHAGEISTRTLANRADRATIDQMLRCN